MKVLKKHSKKLIVLAILVTAAFGAIAYAAVGSITRKTTSIRSSVATGSAAIDFELVPVRGIEVRELRIHFSADAGNDELLTVALDSVSGSMYDTKLTSSSTAIGTGDADYWVRYDPPFVLGLGDELDINWPNTATVTWGLELIYEEK